MKPETCLQTQFPMNMSLDLNNTAEQAMNPNITTPEEYQSYDDEGHKITPYRLFGDVSMRFKAFYRGHISSPFDSPSPPGPEFEDIIPLDKPKQGIKRRFEEAHIPQPNTWPSPIQKHFAEPTEVQAGPNHILERPLKKQKRLSHPARVVEDVTLLSCGHCKREFRAKATYRKQFGHFLVNHKCSGNDRMQFVIGVKHRRCTFSCHPNVGCVNFS